MTSVVNRREWPFLCGLRALALIAVVVWAGGSVAFMFRVGRRNDSTFLMALFTLWVLSPFIGLAFAAVVSKRWPATARATLYGLIFVLTAGALAAYGKVAFGPPAGTPAAMFLLVPLASWLLVATFFAGKKILLGRTK